MSNEHDFEAASWAMQVKRLENDLARLRAENEIDLKSRIAAEKRAIEVEAEVNKLTRAVAEGGCLLADVRLEQRAAQARAEELRRALAEMIEEFGPLATIDMQLFDQMPKAYVQTRIRRGKLITMAKSVLEGRHQ